MSLKARVDLLSYNIDEKIRQQSNPVTGIIEEVVTGISKFLFEGVWRTHY